MKHLPWILLAFFVGLGLANAVPTGLNTNAIPTIIDAAPAEPYACAPDTFMHMVGVDDSDDDLWAMVCVCNFNDDGTGYLWTAVDDPGTPCIFV